MRVVLIGFIIVLLVLSCGLAVRYNQEASHARNELDRERYRRITNEENLQKANIEINALQGELKRMKTKIKNTEIAFKNTKAINVDLKERLDKASRIQMSLDRRIVELQQIASPL